MKAIFTSFLMGSVLLFSSFAQQGGNIDGVITALQSANASELSKYLDDNIELTMPDKSDSYSRAQAQLIIKDFFSNNGVNGFELKHKSDNDQKGGYCIGNLLSRSGKYRTMVYMRVKDSKQVIKEIRFQTIE